MPEVMQEVKDILEVKKQKVITFDKAKDTETENYNMKIL
jgi:hypothetical protein